MGDQTFLGAYQGEGVPRPDGHLPTRMLDAEGSPLSGRYLVESGQGADPGRQGGYYEIQIPQSLLSRKASAIELSWVDFYRR